MHTYSFEKLDVWVEARKLVLWIYKVTANFPSEEKFGLINQMRRAAISVVSNLAEGSARKSAKDQAHFSHTAYGSLIELLNQLIISNDLEFISIESLNEGRIQIQELSRKIAALRNSQLSKVPKSLNPKP
jgi:four helix bundle protein